MTRGVCCGNNTDAWLQGEGFRMTNSFENARGHSRAHAVIRTAFHCSARSTSATKERGDLFWDFLDDCALCCSSDAAACLEPSCLTGCALS